MKKCLMMAGSVFALGVSVLAFAGGPDNMPSSFTAASVSIGAWYAGVEGGVSMLMGDIYKDEDFKYGDNFSTGYDVGLKAGYALTSNLSMEGQAFYIENDGKDDSSGLTAKLWVFMGNVKYAIDMGNAFTPYVGVGLGYINPNNEMVCLEDGVSFDGRMGYQALVGVAYALNSHMDLTLDYHFVRPIGLQDLDDWTIYLPMINLINVGVNYQF